VKIILGQVDIEAAIKQYIGPTGWGIPIDGKEITIEMKSHRGDKDNAFSAEVELSPTGKTSTTQATDVAEEVAEVSEEQQAIDFDFVEVD
jgi:hypothetical protein